MTEYVYRKFPDHAAFIQALKNKDAAFNEIGEEYEERCTRLAAQSGAVAPHAKERLHALEIFRDPEAEIIRK